LASPRTAPKQRGMRNPDQPTRISLFAPAGRMGKAIAAAIEDDPAFVIDQDHGEVLVDFSAPAALQSSVDRAVSAGVPILIGTTGLDDLAERRISAAAKDVAVLRAANTSLGVALLAELVERAARVLGSDWDIEIADSHHRMKADAPSGTALLLGEAAARGRGSALRAERGRDGTGLAREINAIGFASLRGGTVAGDHDVLFLGPDERLILSHRAESRMIFARGALAAARFLVGKHAGLYSMRDVISEL
jgi:4-hydroxy-tetrahydrodipicolinate reductase